MNPETLLRNMTLDDKIALCSGADFWQTKAMPAYGIPSVFMCDGPHGLRKQELEGGFDMLGIHDSLPATCFPAAVTSGASWDPELMARIGAAVGREAAAAGVRLVLGPGANIKRNPLCGRNFEYFSEDPLVTGKMATGFIRGLQQTGTGASLKHFACNNQEYKRFVSDSRVDERTLREIYLSGFEMAVKEAHPESVMCAYNRLNGIYCSDHRRLLTDILRDEWGFDGMVVTDWGAMHDRILAFEAGCDLNMPGGSAYMEKATRRAVKEGRLSEEAIDACTRRVLRFVLTERPPVRAACDLAAHHELACNAAEQGAVLLKNDDGILPLAADESVVLIGSMAKEPRYQGAGSSHINPTRLQSATDCLPDLPYVEGYDARGDASDAMLDAAADAAKQAAIAVVFAGLPARYESEGFDRKNLKMPEGHLRLIETVA